MSLLEMRGVRRTYLRGPERVEALRGIDLSVESGRITAVVGASGSGKTTLLNIAGGVDRPDGGEVIFEGRRIDRLPERDLTALRRARVGMIFQKFHLVAGLTAIQNVRLPLLFSGTRDDGRALALLQRSGIAHRSDFHPDRLSGGEQQRVAIARALVNDPALLLADEPTGSLGRDQAGRILDLFRAFCSDGNLAVLLATHDEEMATRADTIVTLRDGRIC